MGDKRTTLRANTSTVKKLRLSAMEIAIHNGLVFSSDDERISALVEYWNNTKRHFLPAVQGSDKATPSLIVSDSGKSRSEI